MYDLFVNTLNLTGGKEAAGLPNFLVTAAPRRSARGREADLLGILLTFSGSAPMSAEQLRELLEQLGARYFATPGTVTAAMRAAAEALNNFILNRNLRSAGEGWRATGMLNLAVVRRGLLYLGQAGSTRAILINSGGVRTFFDTEAAAQPLGTSRAPLIRYSQMEIQPGDLLVLCANPPAIWSEELLKSATRLSLDVLKRRLIQDAGSGLQFALIQPGPGRGRIIPRRWSALEGQQPTREAAVPPRSAAALPDRPAPPASSPPPFDEDLEEATSGAAAPPPSAPPASAVRAAPPSPRQPSPHAARAARAVIQSASGASAVWGKIKSALGRLGMRMLPGSAEKPAGLSSGAAWFITIAIPLVVVAMATTIYLRTGRGEQQRVYLAQANQFAVQAQTTDDPALRRNSWLQAQYWLERAEQFGISDQTRAARLQIESALDSLDGVSRLELSLAMNDTFPQPVQISRMAFSGQDLYVLDDRSGAVFRLISTNIGFVLDKSFTCGPGQMGALTIAPLIDLAPLEINNALNAAVVALDANGILLYCGPGTDTRAVMLPSPMIGWGKLKLMTLNRDVMHVLDAEKNALWRYDGDRGQFDNPPGPFFSGQVPARFDTFVDMVINAGELFLLRDSGELVQCTYSTVPAIKDGGCRDPAALTDARQGETRSVTRFENALFTRLALSANRDSIYVLDSQNNAIYRFSLKLNLDRVLVMRMQDGTSLAGMTPTAFAAAPGNIFYIAFGDTIYQAQVR